MKKFFTFSALLFFTLTSSANVEPSYTIMSKEEAERFSDYTQEHKERVLEMRRQFDTNGYYNAYSEAAAGLREVEFRKYNGFIDTASDPYYETLRASPSGFPLNFKYAGISFVDKSHLLGYVPSGTETPTEYKGKNYVWTGVTGYFLDDKFGTCRHTVEKIGYNEDTGGKYLVISYDPNRTTYDINNKPTTKNAQGNEQSGYIYEVTWTGKTYDKALECTNKKPFDLETIKELIVLAKKIDLDLPDLNN